MRTWPGADLGDQAVGAPMLRPCRRCQGEFLAVAVPGLSAFDSTLSPFPDLCLQCRILEAAGIPVRRLPAWVPGI